MAVQNGNNYLNSIRTHLSLRRSGPELMISSNTVEEEPDDRQTLQLRPTQSHNENDAELPFEQPQWECTSLLSDFQPTPEHEAFASACREFINSNNLAQPLLKSIESKRISNIPKYTYPNGESSLIRRGVFKGIVDRRPAGCAFSNTRSLSHCTFKNCYCMRVPVVPSPLRNGCGPDDYFENDENDNESLSAVSMDDPSSFGGKIRHISWTKLKNFVEPATTEPRETWATFDDFNSNLGNALLSSIVPHEAQRLKRFFIHDNFKRMVHRGTLHPVSDNSVRQHSSPSSTRYGPHKDSHRVLTRSLSTGSGGVRRVRSVSSPM